MSLNSYRTLPLLQGGGLAVSGYIEIQGSIEGRLDAAVLLQGVRLSYGDKWARPDLNWGLKLPKLRA